MELLSDSLDSLPRDDMPGLNPQFVARVHAKRRQQAAACRAAMVFSQPMQPAPRMRDEVAESIAAQLRSGEDPGLTRVLVRAMRHFNVTWDELCSYTKRQRAIDARNMVYYWSLRLTRMSRIEIAEAMCRNTDDDSAVRKGAPKWVKRRAAQGRMLPPPRRCNAVVE
jgi:hypothetical protein